jgi:RNA polymerase sigma-70 factor (ECF subfamily)
VERHPDDAILVRRCLAGDADAWQALAEAHRRRMIALARRILPVQDAEDVVDAVLADLWERRKLIGYEGRSSLRTWLGAIVLNSALNARRASASRATLVAAVPPAPAAAVDSTAARQLHTVLRDAIASLDAAMRTLVLLYYEQDLSLDAVGRLFGLSKSTLSRTLKDARERIRVEADRLSRERCGVPLAALREGIDLAQLDLDLRAACGEPGNDPSHGVSKKRDG